MALPAGERMLIARIGRGIQIRLGNMGYEDLEVHYEALEIANPADIAHIIRYCDIYQ